MFGKVNPAPAVSKSIRMVFWSLPEPLKLLKPLKTTQKHDINENHIFFAFLSWKPSTAPSREPSLRLPMHQRSEMWYPTTMLFILFGTGLRSAQSRRNYPHTPGVAERNLFVC